MSTLEATVSMLEGLTDDQLICIQGFARRYLLQPKVHDPYQPLTEDEMLTKLSISRTHADDGFVKAATQSVSDLKAKYGL